MAEGLLKTKLHPPTARHRLVVRQVLLEKLSKGFQAGIPFTLVSAPAGFGKTTLIGNWVTRAGIPFAWLTLDEGDNDPLRFWRYIDAAFQTIDPRLGKGQRPSLLSPQPPAIRQVLTGLVNDIVEFDQPFILVIEDYHLIEHPDIHEHFNFLLDHTPAGAHLVVTTRSDPPFHLARRRSRAQISELRAADLRFSLEETADFINDTMRLGLPPNDIAALERRTEGWIAGLQMAALSLQDENDPHAFVTAFSGDDRHIADYLIEEVLQRQPLDFQRFLLQTSVLNRLSAPLCDAVTGREDSQAILNMLERTNLFILPLDNQREWFRYHQLFAQLLQKRLFDTEGKSGLQNLKRSASRWYAENGHIVEAVEISLSIEDYGEAANTIEGSESILFTGPDLNMLRKWSKIFPLEVIKGRQRLNVMAAWANHATGHPDQAEYFVQLMEQDAGIGVDDFLETYPAARGLSPIQRSALLEGAVVRTRIAVDLLELDRAFRLAKLTLPHLVASQSGEPHAFNLPENLRCVELFNLGLVHKFRGELNESARVMAEAAIEALMVRNPHIIALSLGHHGEIQMMQGELNAAFRTFQKALDESQTFPTLSSSFWGVSKVGLGNLFYERNDLDAAETFLQEGVELGKIWNSWESLLPGMTGLTRLYAARGEWEMAHAALDNLLEWGELNAPIIRPAAERERAWLHYRQGNLEAASRWASSFQLENPGHDKLQWIREALLVARIDLARGEMENSSTLVKRLLQDALEMGYQRDGLEAQCLQALLLEHANGSTEAFTTLRHVLSQAEPQGYMRLFVDVGDAMQALLTKALPSLREHPPLALYAGKLLAAFKPDQKPDQAGLIEPLTERELDVLRFMAQGQSNPEIARRLYISPNTVKAHSQNIFSKLNVHNRVEAANKAKELELVD